MWSILENVPCALEKKVYSSAFGCNVLKVSVRSISSNVSFKTCGSLLIFYFDDLSMGVNGVLKPPTIIVLQSNFFLGLLVFVYVLRCSYVGSKQSILKQISPGISLETMMLKLKLQYFGHLMRKVDSLEKT